VDGRLRLYAYLDPPAQASLLDDGGSGLWFVDWIGDRWSEACPVANGGLEDQTIFFSASIDGGLGGEDIYAVEIEAGRESAPISVGPPINTPADEYVAAVPRDHSLMIFYRYDPRSGESAGLYISFWEDGERTWSHPRSLDSLLGFENPGFDASLSPDGRYVFILERGVGPYWVDISRIRALASK
jgi:hypothetical protein